jgi:hypothetical protein
LYSFDRSQCSTEPSGRPLVCSSASGDVLDVVEARVGADGLGLLAGDLEAVVLAGIVAGGDLHAAAGAQVVDGKIHLRGVDHADIDDVGAGGVHALDEGLVSDGLWVRISRPTQMLWALARPRFVAVQHRPQELGRGMADLPGRLLVQLVGVKPRISYALKIEGSIHQLRQLKISVEPVNFCRAL